MYCNSIKPFTFFALADFVTIAPPYYCYSVDLPYVPAVPFRYWRDLHCAAMTVVPFDCYYWLDALSVFVVESCC
jgi:hypothetical protein